MGSRGSLIRSVLHTENRDAHHALVIVRSLFDTPAPGEYRGTTLSIDIKSHIVSSTIKTNNQTLFHHIGGPGPPASHPRTRVESFVMQPLRYRSPFGLNARISAAAVALRTLEMQLYYGRIIIDREGCLGDEYH